MHTHTSKVCCRGRLLGLQRVRMDESLSTYLPRFAASASTVLRCGEVQQKHESFIFNSVSLGQWESARASFRCLALCEEAGVRENAKELLKILILEAAKFWLALIYSCWTFGYQVALSLGSGMVPCFLRNTVPSLNPTLV